MNLHQQKQIEVINEIEKQIKIQSLQLSTVEPVDDFENDKRICLTSVHLPGTELIEKIYSEIIKPLRKINPDHYYYPRDSLHLTIKNIRVINYPPHFDNQDIEKAKQIFDTTISQHHKFKVYFYRLLLFPLNLALMGTTDEELDKIILDLDEKLTKAGVPDDKKYINDRYFFSNMTLARLYTPPTEKFINKVNELSKNFIPFSYLVDSVTLITGTVSLRNKKIIGQWQLK